MVIAYLVSLIGGVAIGVTVKADRTLTALKENPDCIPGMAAGSWLRKRYIEVIGVSVLVWMAVAAFLVFNAESLAEFGLLALAGVGSYCLLEYYEPAIQQRFRHGTGRPR